MSFLARLGRGAIMAAMLLAVAGCAPGGSGQLEDEKEPHYVLGKSRVNAMDYAGAVEAFTESLEVNPRSAAAHFQLACLFDTRAANPAAAIYHYQEFLRLNPGAQNAEVIRQRIYSCKQQLAADVLPLPSAPAAQQQVEKLAGQNRQLQAQVDQLNDVIRQWNAYYAAQPQATRVSEATPATGSAQPAAGNANPDDTSPGTAARPARTSGTTTGTTTAQAAARARARTHQVVRGETMASIARKSGVSLTALQAANPGVNPRKMPAGQILNLP